MFCCFISVGQAQQPVTITKPPPIGAISTEYLYNAMPPHIETTTGYSYNVKLKSTNPLGALDVYGGIN